MIALLLLFLFFSISLGDSLNNIFRFLQVPRKLHFLNQTLVVNWQWDNRDLKKTASSLWFSFKSRKGPWCIFMVSSERLTSLLIFCLLPKVGLCYYWRLVTPQEGQQQNKLAWTVSLRNVYGNMHSCLIQRARAHLSFLNGARLINELVCIPHCCRRHRCACAIQAT